jgi:hypothetical protein
MSSIIVKNKFAIELKRAQSARQAGNEGQARVCARRAAGFALREFLKDRRDVPPGLSIPDLFSFVERLVDFPEDGKRIAGLMQMRVDVDHQLPEEVDLVAEAQKLIAIFGFE